MRKLILSCLLFSATLHTGLVNASVDRMDASQTVVALGEMNKGDPLAVNCKIDQVIKEVEQEESSHRVEGRRAVSAR